MGTSENDVSIYEHIRAHVPVGPGLAEGGMFLPDEPEPEPGSITFAPGLMDQILELGSPSSSEEAAARAFHLLEDAVKDPSSSDAYDRLHEELRANDLLGFLDPLIRRVFQSRLRRSDVRRIALPLATRSNDRMSVKVGIALLGLCATLEDRPTLLTLGRHEEFTHYVGVTFTTAFPDPEPALWDLAKVVEHWGRAALVRQLASTRDPEIKAWIVREGVPHVSDVALIAATAGGLVDELKTAEIDETLCLSAGRILSTLIEDRPYPESDDIDDYEDGPEAIRLYLSHLSRREPNLESVEPVWLILEYLELRGGVSPHIYSPFRERMLEQVANRPLVRWSDAERLRAASSARWFLQRPDLREGIEEGFGSPDRYEFYLASNAAALLGDDTVPVLLDRLRSHPEDDMPWIQVAGLIDADRLESLLAIALGEIGRHRSDRGPFFPDWLRALTDALGRFPGEGWPLLRAALGSPTMMERRFGIRGVEGFPDGSWPSEASMMLDAIARSDPDLETREWAEEVLSDRGFAGRGRVTTP